MTYQIYTAFPFPSNKPTNPAIEPNAKDFPHKHVFANGQRIWLSNPKPDKIDIVVPLVEQVLSAWIVGEFPIEDRVAKVSQFLTSGAANCHLCSNAKYSTTKKYLYQFCLMLGANEAVVFFRLLTDTKYGVRLKISYNPSRLGMNGHSQLFALLFGSQKLGIADLFNATEFSTWAKITRLDIAIDCIGAKVSEVLFHHSESDHRIFYTGPTGMETAYMRRPKSGQSFFKAYNKAMEVSQGGQIGEYSPAAFTRLEITKRNLHKRYLRDLFDLPDPFKKLRAGYLFGQGFPSAKHLQIYRSLRLSYSKAEAMELIGLSAEREAKLSKVMKVPTPQFIRAGKTWKGWEEGCCATGIGALL